MSLPLKQRLYVLGGVCFSLVVALVLLAMFTESDGGVASAGMALTLAIKYLSDVDGTQADEPAPTFHVKVDDGEAPAAAATHVEVDQRDMV